MSRITFILISLLHTSGKVFGTTIGTATASIPELPTFLAPLFLVAMLGTVFLVRARIRR